MPMGFPDSFLDELKSRIVLSDVVRRKVKLQKRGREFMGLCPFHNEKTPSFTVSDDKGFYYCFGCGASGDAINFVKETENLDFQNTIEFLAQQIGLAIPASAPDSPEAQKKPTLRDAMNEALRFYHHQLYQKNGQAALDYLKNRGLTEATIEKFKLGFAPDTFGAVKQQLMQKDFAEDDLITAGLLIRPESGQPNYDRFRGRVMFPILDMKQQCVGFGGRILNTGEPKYLNSPETPLFHKNQLLYNLQNARDVAKNSGRLVVVEGYMDVIALDQAGIRDAVAPLGTAMGEAQILLLWRYSDEAILCFDGDMAGSRAAMRAVERALPLLRPNKTLRLARLPEKEDPDSIVQKWGAAKFEAILSEALPVFDFLLQNFGLLARDLPPERRAGRIDDVTKLLQSIQHETLRGLYLSMLQEKLATIMPQAQQPFRQNFQTAGRGAWQAMKKPFAPAMQAPRHTEGLSYKLAEGFLLSLVNQPGLIESYAEEIAHLDFGTGPLAKLQQTLLQYAAEYPEALETSQLIDYIEKAGEAMLLARREDRSLWALCPYLQPDLPADERAAAWQDALKLLQKGQQNYKVPQQDGTYS